MSYIFGLENCLKERKCPDFFDVKVKGRHHYHSFFLNSNFTIHIPYENQSGETEFMSYRINLNSYYSET